MNHPISRILQQCLINNSKATAPSSETSWPAYYSFMPNESDNCICVYDTEGLKSARKMSGENIKFPACQITIRSIGYEVGWTRATLIESFLESLSNEIINVESNTYKIQAIMQQGTLNAIGPEPDGKRRDSFTINVMIEIEQTV